MRSSDKEADEDDSVGTERYYSGYGINALRSLLEDVGDLGECQSWSPGICTFADRRLSSDHPPPSLQIASLSRKKKSVQAGLISTWLTSGALRYQCIWTFSSEYNDYAHTVASQQWRVQMRHSKIGHGMCKLNC